MGCSVVTINEMRWKTTLSMNWSVSISSWSWLFMGNEWKNKTTNSPSWEEFPQRVWAHSQREGKEPDIGEPLGEELQLLPWLEQEQAEVVQASGHGCCQDIFLGRKFPPSRPWGRHWARWEDYTSHQPLEQISTLSVVEKIVRVSLLTLESHKQREMDQNKIKVSNSAI